MAGNWIIYKIANSCLHSVHRIATHSQYKKSTNYKNKLRLLWDSDASKPFETTSKKSNYWQYLELGKLLSHYLYFIILSQLCQ